MISDRLVVQRLYHEVHQLDVGNVIASAHVAPEGRCVERFAGGGLVGHLDKVQRGGRIGIFETAGISGGIAVGACEQVRNGGYRGGGVQVEAIVDDAEKNGFIDIGVSGQMGSLRRNSDGRQNQDDCKNEGDELTGLFHYKTLLFCKFSSSRFLASNLIPLYHKRDKKSIAGSIFW